MTDTDMLYMASLEKRNSELEAKVAELEVVKMTFDEAIKHCLEVAEARETEVLKYNYCRGIPDVEKVVSDCKECAADHRQLAEWLTELKELREENINIKNDNERLRDCVDSCVLNGELDYAELAEAKRLLKAAVEDLYNSVNDVHCKYCSKWHTDQCQGTSHLDCYIENKFKWRHADEALTLIGQDGDTNG